MRTNRNQLTRNLKVFMALAAILFGVAAAAKIPEVPFPDGYRSWQHVKSVVVDPERNPLASEGGKIFHFYANPQAVEGYRTGTFPNGSVLVRETLRTIVVESDSKSALTEGERSALDVMMKDDRLYQETGGWGFETFDSKNARLAEKDRAQCYTCHSKQKDHDLVFTTLPAEADGGTPYPEGYRRWTFLHSSMVSPAFDAFAKKPCEKPCGAGLFHFYANDKAMDGLRTGSYPDGAMFAEEMLEWLPNSNGGGKEGPRRLVGVMVRNSQRYSSTGGWGYGMFDDGSRADRLDAKMRDACYQCHVPRKDQGYIFTQYRDR
jgi:Cytochrome P460